MFVVVLVAAISVGIVAWCSDFANLYILHVFVYVVLLFEFCDRTFVFEFMQTSWVIAVSTSPSGGNLVDGSPPAASFQVSLIS